MGNACEGLLATLELDAWWWLASPNPRSSNLLCRFSWTFLYWQRRQIGWQRLLLSSWV
ncbi:unnamed protein product [Prunus armeniaca]